MAENTDNKQARFRQIKVAERDAASAIDELKASRRDGADVQALLESAVQRLESAHTALRKLLSAKAEG